MYLQGIFVWTLVLFFSGSRLVTSSDPDRFLETLETDFFVSPAEEVDIVFIVDRSESMSLVHGAIDTVFAFIKNLLAGFDIGKERTRVAIVTYSTSVVTDYNSIPNDLVPDNLDKCQLFSTVDRISRAADGFTATTEAQRAARDILLNSRPEAKKKIVLITDGISDIGEDPEVASRELLSLLWNITWTSQLDIFAVGMGDASLLQLRSIASNETYAIRFESVDNFRLFAVNLNTDEQEENWEVVETEKCISTCSGQAVCLCGLVTGAYQCACDVGYQGSGAKCEECPLGRYKSERTPDPCVECPNGKTTNSAGAANISQCVCPLGYTDDFSGGCRVTTCNALPPVANSTRFQVDGVVLSETANTGHECNYTVHTSCHYECDYGYRLVASRAVACLPLSDGTGYWYGDLPSCEEIRCHSVPDVGVRGDVTYDQNGPTYPIGTRVSVSCYLGYRSFGDLQRECTGVGIWSGTPAQCRGVQCPPLLPIQYATVSPKNCTMVSHEVNSLCQYICKDGFDFGRTSPDFLKRCQSTSQWTDHGNYAICIDIQAPQIDCPTDMEDYVEINKTTRLVHWDRYQPNVTENSDVVSVTPLVPYQSPHEFPVGSHHFTWRAEDGAGYIAQCSFSLVIKERTPIIRFCPDDFTNKTSNSSGAHVDWPYPVFGDGHGHTIPDADITCLSGAYPGMFFPIGEHNIHCYPAGHSEVACLFTVRLEAYECSRPAAPLNGSVSCNAAPLAGYQQVCTIYCHAGSEFAWTPAEGNTYRCDYSGRWTCEGVDQCLPWPDCSKRYLSGTARVSSDAFYYYGDCENAKDEIRQSFLDQYGPSNVTCGNDMTFSCSVENVTVECGDFAPGRKRRDVHLPTIIRELRAAEEGDGLADSRGGPRSRRASQSQNTRVSFDIIIVVNSVDVTEDVQFELYYLSVDVYYELETVQNSGIDLVINNNVVPQVSFDLVYDGVVPNCEEGQIERLYDVSSAECIDCPKGSFWQNKSICAVCEVGSYQDQERQTECIPCPNGKTTVMAGSKNEEDCKDWCTTGQWSESGLEPCRPCSIGHYQDAGGATSCQKCPHLTTTTVEGATSRSDCIALCLPGTYSGNGLSPCQPCRQHHYQPEVAQTDCMACPGGRETLASGTAQEEDCIAVDDCQSNPCQNAGTCLDGIGSYTCICAVGFLGGDCEIDIDECQSDPCMNDATCTDLPNGYRCTCAPGFSGDLCEENIDECQSSPCHTGSCVDLVNGFECLCPDDRYGDLCDEELTFCLGCDHGTCDGAKCHCDPGYSGSSCSDDIDECLSEPCMNGATCIDQVNEFECQCRPGFIGVTCSSEINECDSNPCQNFIQCHDEVNSYRCQCKPSYTGLNCLTRESTNFDLVFTGDVAEFIEVAASDLAFVTQLSICLWLQTDDQNNRGTIFSYTLPDQRHTDVVALYDYTNLKFSTGTRKFPLRVSLNDGFWHHVCFTWRFTSGGETKIYKDGRLIEELQYDLPMGGTLTVGQFTHVAQGGYVQRRAFIGEMSRLNIYNTALSAGEVSQLAEKSTPCTLSYVNDDSLVIAWPDLLRSLSDEQRDTMYREASQCGDDNECLDVTFCPENRLCVNRPFEDAKCDCLPGWIGDSCEYVIDNCRPTSPCQNGAACTTVIGNYICNCQPGYEGKNCELVIDFCKSNPCQHGGTCNTKINSYVCVCPDPVRQTGPNCEILDLCIGHQCGNGATCVPRMTDYSCNCAQGYTGTLCDSVIDYCQPNPCRNGATCESSLSGFECTCPDSYTGDYCQTLFSPCHLSVSPCLNGGTCETAYDRDNKYRCRCAPGFNPPNCERTNPCFDEPCQDNGVCVLAPSMDDGFQCACRANYHGPRCGHYVAPTEPPVVDDICILKPCKNDGVCSAISGLDYVCDCEDTQYFGIICHLYTKLRLYEARLKINEMDYNSALIGDDDFKTTFGRSISNVFVEVIGNVKVNVTNILPGSVIMEYGMTHEANISHDSEMPSEETMAEIFNQALLSGFMPPFKVSADTFLLTEQECKAGYWSESGHEPDCKPCGIGYYQASEGATECNPCQSDQTTSDVDSTSPDDCIAVISGTPTVIIVITVVCVLAFILIIVVLVVCIYKKRQTAKPPPSPNVLPENWADQLLPGQKLALEEAKLKGQEAPRVSLYTELPEAEVIMPYAEYKGDEDPFQGKRPPDEVVNRPRPEPPKEGDYLAPVDVKKSGFEETGDYLPMIGQAKADYQKLNVDANGKPANADGHLAGGPDSGKSKEDPEEETVGYTPMAADLSVEGYQKLNKDDMQPMRNIYLSFDNPVVKYLDGDDIEMETRNQTEDTADKMDYENV